MLLLMLAAALPGCGGLAGATAKLQSGAEAQGKTLLDAQVDSAKSLVASKVEGLKDRATSELAGSAGALGDFALDAAGAALSNALVGKVEARSTGSAQVVPTSTAQCPTTAPSSTDGNGQPIMDLKVNELTNIVVARIRPGLLVSIKLCEYQLRRETAEKDLKAEKQAAKYSGTLDTERVHDAARRMADYDQKLADVTGALAREYQVRPHTCAGRVRATAQCLISTDGCVIPAGEVASAWTFAEARLNGQPVQERETALRGELTPAMASWADEAAAAIVTGPAFQH